MIFTLMVKDYIIHKLLILNQNSNVNNIKLNVIQQHII